MENKHTKSCSTSLIIRKIQIQTTIKYLFLCTRIAKIKMINNTHCWLGYWAPGTPIHHWWDAKWIQLGSFSESEANSICIFPVEIKSHVPTNTCMWIFIVFLFITTLSQLWYIRTTGYNSARKRSRLLMHTRTQINLKSITWSDRSQT